MYVGCVVMLTLNIFETIVNELINFLKDIKSLFIETFSGIHQFLNRFMSDDIITMLGIALAAFIAILIFRAVINKR